MHPLTPPPAASRPSRYVQAIPVYLASDVEVKRYFTECRGEIDAITGRDVAVLLAAEVAASDAAGVAAVIERDGSGRFAGLRFADLPCLWLEDEFGRHDIMRLPHSFPEIGQALRLLADACRRSKDVPTISDDIATRAAGDAKARSPLLRVMLEELPMNKAAERRVAVICGVAFVAAILVNALFVPNPTPFSYTVFRIVLALAAAGFVSMTPGFIEAKVGNVLRAGGALAVFAVVYFYAPAALPR